MRFRLAPLLIALTVLFAACDKDKDVEPPAALVTLTPKLAVSRVWSLGVGGKDKRLRLALAPVVSEGRVYAAGATGNVFAIDEQSGKVLWKASTKLPLAGGPGVGNGVVAVGASNGQVVALDAQTGARLWQVGTTGEVLAAPALSAQSVIVRSVDGRVRAFALTNGKEQWQNEEQIPRLSLRGTAPPVIAGDSVVCGFDDGKAIAYSLATGDRLWEATVDAPRGRTEIERLSDIDGAVRISGRDVFAVGFQGKLSMLALDSGQVWWSRDVSSYRGLALGDENVYVATADGHVQALRRRDGTVVWNYDGLLRRGLTAPAIDGNTVVVADFEGYVHWIDRTEGTMLARYNPKKGRVTNAPVAADGMVFLQVDSGHLYALRATGNGRETAPSGAPTATIPPAKLPADLSPFAH